MSADVPERVDHPDAGQGDAKPTVTRIDAPHVLGDHPAVTPPGHRDLEPTASGASVSIAVEAKPADAQHEAELSQQVELQAAQLGRRLQSWQRELARREAQLNAQQSELESSARAARLWLRDKQGELEQRDLDLEQWKQALSLREAELHEVAKGDSAERSHAAPSTKHSPGPTSVARLRRTTDASENQTMLESLRGELVEQHDRLVEQARRLRRWFQRRQQELDWREEHLRRAAKSRRQDIGPSSSQAAQR
jgi:hypothetical protein